MSGFFRSEDLWCFFARFAEGWSCSLLCFLAFLGAGSPVVVAIVGEDGDSNNDGKGIDQGGERGENRSRRDFDAITSPRSVSAAALRRRRRRQQQQRGGELACFDHPDIRIYLFM